MHIEALHHQWPAFTPPHWQEITPPLTVDGYDKLYVPRMAYTTGDIDIHDVAVDKNGRVIFVNTMFSCLATVGEGASFY
ncbi:MAG TPA: DUF4915 domain-containing protein, partial [Burkholderiales bacterium]|nr:DUF4915 domain-containing protein [Burkholderiales bacterium]